MPIDYHDDKTRYEDDNHTNARRQRATYITILPVTDNRYIFTVVPHHHDRDRGRRSLRMCASTRLYQ